MMSRYKGHSGSKAVERNFRHVVEMAVPPNGLGKRLDAMYDWHRARDVEPQRGRGDEGRDIIRWCFADAKTAADFAAAFSGTAIRPGCGDPIGAPWMR